MRKSKLLFLFLAASLAVIGQQKPLQPSLAAKPGKKYPSLLWEITGKGLQRPSYLFGTMHVSDKLAFHLGDSFYNAIKSVQVVALETNPDSWQDDYSKSIFFSSAGQLGDNFYLAGMNRREQMDITSFAIDDYDEAIKASLAVEPSLVNGLLYRTYGSGLADFEEDTFLDMYIFQTGKKLGKQLAGVENFEQSEKLVIEAYRDMYRDRNRKKRSFDMEDMYTNPKKVEDAYRQGDLDLLDSLDALTVISDAFQEKFLYKRNEIQAHSIDSIIKKSSLFVAVGAAHLPGKRGVIEMLRQMGYTLRPVRMDNRNSVQKEAIEKIRSKSNFINQVSDDGFYRVSIPGKKFYNFTEWMGMNVVQYADMVNGAYYMVTRIKTNSFFMGHPADAVHRKIDSLLYENIPGKILRKTPISKNGYKGWEILNRTRRGDYQRYNIFITPFEILVFKMSGNGEYINQGNEAQQFFGSVKLKETGGNTWNDYQPATGGFRVQLPNPPSLLKNENFGANRLEYAAFDAGDGNSYLIMKSNFHHFDFVEEDSFELNLMQESYAYSSFIDTLTSRLFTRVSGYPALQASYRHKDGSSSTVKYIIRGPVYYIAAVHHKNFNEGARKFIESFSITPFIYPEPKKRVDTMLHFTVESPFFDDKKDETMTRLLEMVRLYSNDDEEEDGLSPGLFGNLNFKQIGNDTLGEKIWITYRKPGEYSYIKDTVNFWKKYWNADDENDEHNEDSTFIFRADKRYDLPGGIKCREMQYTDTGSSRLVLVKHLYKDGHLFSLSAVTDTLNVKTPFLEKFFSTFTPADTLKGVAVFTKKTDQFFRDYFSADSIVAKKARRSLYEVKFDSTDVPVLKTAIEKVNWNTKNYLEVKKYFIAQLAALKDAAISPYLRDLYWKVKDSSELQHAILNALLQQQTKESFTAFRDIMLQEPPVKDAGNYSSFTPPMIFRDDVVVSMSRNINYGGGSYYGQWMPLYDTLSLTRTLFPDFLQLMNVDDYEREVTDLLTTMVDSSLLKGEDYEPWFSKLYADGKQLLKKQVVKEEQNNIEKASRKDQPPSFYYGGEEEESEMDAGNEELKKYAILLLPFYDKKPGVPAFYDQLLKTKDRQLLYDLFILLLRNKRPVADSLFSKYAALDKYRSRLYADLKKIKQLDRFPASYKTQAAIARSLLIENKSGYNKPDSVVFLDKLPVSYKGKKGWVYFFKYKQARDDDFWQLASVGMQPENPEEIDTENTEFYQEDNRKLQANKPVQAQLEEMLKEMVYSKRSSAGNFYNARRYNLYKNYLSEMVKNQRFKD